MKANVVAPPVDASGVALVELELVVAAEAATTVCVPIVLEPVVLELAVGAAVKLIVANKAVVFDWLAVPSSRVVKFPQVMMVLLAK